MNIPKSIQEVVFLAVCHSKAGAGIEQPWDDEEYTAQTFDSKGQFVRRGFVSLSGNVRVPFTATFTFGKPRRSNPNGAGK
jgi:hypothetical protein